MAAALALDDQVATETRWCVELTLTTPGAAFHAELVREDWTWWDDDPTPDVTDTVVSERELEVTLPAVFAAVDEWLIRHHLRVLPHMWAPCESGSDTGMVLLLEGRALPVRPVSRGCQLA